MTSLEKLVIVGAGGFGPEVLWAVRNINATTPRFAVLGFCDDDPAKKNQQIDGHAVLGAPEDVNRTIGEKPSFVCAIGNNRARIKVVDLLLKMGWKPASVIDPSVMVAQGVRVGDGSYVGAGGILSPHATLGHHVIINHHCSIGHDSRLEDFVQMSPGGRVSGYCTLGRGAMLASNAALAPGVAVGAFVTVGACSFAMDDVPEGATAVGIPARVMFRASQKSLS